MQQSIEKKFQDIVSKKQKGWIACCLRLMLWIFSLPYRLYVNILNWMYNHNWLRRYCPPVPVVISVGNIVVGGTGKTPMTLKIAQEFYHDYVIAILSRGYRSPAEKLISPIMLSNRDGPMQSAAFCGDEPYLLSQRLPKAYVFVGKNRHKAADMAAREGVQLILLDDGMQHRRLARDFDVVVIDATDPFGQGHYLPRGFLREGCSGLSRASLLIINHVETRESFDKIKRQLMTYSSAPIIGTQVNVLGIKTLSDLPIESLEKMKIGIFCGIAHPDYFHRTVSSLGANIVHHAYVGDHKELTPQELVTFARECKELGAELILCTEKDKIKLSENIQLALPLAWLEIGIKIVEGEEQYQAFIDQIKARLTI